LLALGFVIIFKASGVLNFAHGSLVLLGGYIAVRTENDLHFLAPRRSASPLPGWVRCWWNGCWWPVDQWLTRSRWPCSPSASM